MKLEEKVELGDMVEKLEEKLLEEMVERVELGDMEEKVELREKV